TAGLGGRACDEESVGNPVSDLDDFASDRMSEVLLRIAGGLDEVPRMPDAIPLEVCVVESQADLVDRMRRVLDLLTRDPVDRDDHGNVPNGLEGHVPMPGGVLGVHDVRTDGVERTSERPTPGPEERHVVEALGVRKEQDRGVPCFDSLCLACTRCEGEDM